MQSDFTKFAKGGKMERRSYGDMPIPEFRLLKGDCLETLKQLEDNSIDAVLCDPPYHLTSTTGNDKGFMGKSWDGGDIAFRTDVWRECYRVLKPGGHLVAFGGTRTIHRITCAIEDSGFEIRDQLNWLYFSGFPKSLNISKATSIDAKEWKGWGTALKPAAEPACLARKPLEKGLTVAENVVKWGTGGLNIDKSRFRYGDPCWVGPNEDCSHFWDDTHQDNFQYYKESTLDRKKPSSLKSYKPTGGRWPANIYNCKKPSRAEKEAGLEHLPSITGAEAVGRKEGSAGVNNPRAGAGRTAAEIKNTHPTVKPIGLFSWLANLICRPGGTILDPFVGSGTTAVAGILEGFDVIGCELTPEYWPIIEGRVTWAEKEWKNKHRQYKLF